MPPAPPTSHGTPAWPWLLILTLPLALQSLNNGQVNLLVAGLLLAAVVTFDAGRLAAAAACVTAAFLLKGYPLALGLLFAVVEPRRFGWRLAAGVALGLAVPFALQSPEYVWRQYADWLARLGVDDRSGWPLYAGYQDVPMLFRVAGCPLTRDAARLLSAAAGSACAAVVVAGRWEGWDRGRLVAACGGLGVCWMTLFGPATETCTFVLIAPLLAREVVRGRPAAVAGYALLLAALVALWFPKEVSRPVLSLGVQPLGAALLAAAVVRDVRAGRSPGDRP